MEDCDSRMAPSMHHGMPPAGAWLNFPLGRFLCTQSYKRQKVTIYGQILLLRLEGGTKLKSPERYVMHSEGLDSRDIYALEQPGLA